MKFKNYKKRIVAISTLSLCSTIAFSGSNSIINKQISSKQNKKHSSQSKTTIVQDILNKDIWFDWSFCKADHGFFWFVFKKQKTGCSNICCKVGASGLRKTIQLCNSLVHRTTWLTPVIPYRSEAKRS